MRIIFGSDRCKACPKAQVAQETVAQETQEGQVAPLHWKQRRQVAKKSLRAHRLLWFSSFCLACQAFSLVDARMTARMMSEKPMSIMISLQKANQVVIVTVSVRTVVMR